MTPKDKLRTAILDNGWLQRGEFILSSGKKSNYYIDIRPGILSSRTLHLITSPLVDHLRGRVCSETVLCGLLTSGLVLMGALVDRLSLHLPEVSGCLVRTKERTHGTGKQIEGNIKPTSKVILLDDVATSGRSLVHVSRVLLDAGIAIQEAIVIVDREEGAGEALAAVGVSFSPILRVSELL